MKIINDYFKFDEYRKRAEEHFRPKLEEIVNKGNANLLEEIALLRKNSVKLSIIFSISIFLTILTVAIILLLKGSVIILIFAVIPGIVALFSSFILGSKKSKIKDLTKQISQNVIDNFKPEIAYKQAIYLLDRGMEYLGTSSKIAKKTNISRDEIKYFTPTEIVGSLKAKITTTRPVQQLLIDEKFVVGFTNVRWEWKEIVNNTTVINERITGILKIDTSILAEKVFDFRLLKPSGWFSSSDKVRLENEDFNNVFSPESKDKLKIRKMYTPLAMELSLKRYFDQQGVKVWNVAIESVGNSVYFTYNCQWNFMYLDFPESVVNPDGFINQIFEDFLTDTYSLYYLLSLIYITLYLD
ncbi:DUF3137 domain-containing protein [Mycoplasma sp. 'Moose RK']|uniref:DUF3137 domain-containing protein n=1 Tax=Mycoplasma sp. 'Moose RK' TaxID=2780095 RepID=UPI0018C26379|nr:DUF3137 domain-containing protein [Mycoplasma sp. 'Moose RK']MBG0730978.1 DUF3137 domain-containing protein [Mycoplasma sp. 'Moose RK']